MQLTEWRYIVTTVVSQKHTKIDDGGLAFDEYQDEPGSINAFYSEDDAAKQATKISGALAQRLC